MAVVTTLGDRILDAIRHAPLDDDVLAKRLGVGHRQAVNQAARRLAAQGQLRRLAGPDGKILNALPEAPQPSIVDSAPSRTSNRDTATLRITEDEVKGAVRDHLVSQGFEVAVAWGRVRGIDLEAHHFDERRYVVDAKGEAGTSGAQRVNYFLGVIGELVQRMDDAEASYGIALPDNRQYRGLVDRLPGLAKERLRLAVFWVRRTGDGLAVEVES